MKTHKSPNCKWRMNQRILLMLILLMLIVFISVFFAFNVFVRGYIRSNVDAQLNGLVDEMPEHFGDKTPESKKNDWGDDPQIPDLSGQPKNKVGAKGEIFIVDVGYSLVDYNPANNREEILEIAECLEKKAVILESAQSVFVKTDHGEYYISSIPDKMRSEAFMVFYVEVSVLNSLVRTINVSLGIILLIALFFCLIIANSIAKSIITPVKEISDFSVEIGKGNFTKSELVFQDIELDELMAEMNQSAEKLEQYDSEQKVFFQNVSHELRTPLMSIRCFAEGIAYGLMDAKKSGVTIIAETDRLSALVEDLLYISRIDSTKTAIEMSENDLRETISIAAAALQPMADKKGIVIEYQFDEDPVLFYYNENHLYRAIINLISNGIRYAKASIILRCHQGENGIILSFTDDGMGVLPEELPHIFERFYKGKGGKHGVGLSIVKSVVELHHGEISVSEFSVEEGASTHPPSGLTSGNPPPTQRLEVGGLPSAHADQRNGTCFKITFLS